MCTRDDKSCRMTNHASTASELIIEIIKVFIKRKILSEVTILSAYTHTPKPLTHTHPKAPAHTSIFSDYVKLNLHSLNRQLADSIRSRPERTGWCVTHTMSIAFRHLPPNSARFSYATEEALFISVQLSSARSAPSERSGY